MSKPFKFKQFTIHQDRCAMKVGTDGVLLGAWASVNHNPNAVLDIGAGTGLVALMLAQRCNAELMDAIEVDDDAFEQCVENFEASPWGDRLFCYHAGFDEFVDEIDDQYDLIVSNPPFFKPPLTPPKGENSVNEARETARFNNSLPFDELIEGVAKLLSDKGKFCCIIPSKEEQNLIDLGAQQNLYPNKITRVKGTPNTEIKRSLMEFSFQKSEAKISELTIETERHKYTEDYISLTKEFYLKM